MRLVRRVALYKHRPRRMAAWHQHDNYLHTQLTQHELNRNVNKLHTAWQTKQVAGMSYDNGDLSEVIKNHGIIIIIMYHHQLYQEVMLNYHATKDRSAVT